jgi:hypothetical protein
MMSNFPVEHCRQLAKQFRRNIDPPGLLAFLAGAGILSNLLMLGGLHDPPADVARKRGANAFFVADAGIHG